MLLFGFVSLTNINSGFCVFIEDTDIQKFSILASTKHIFKDILIIFNTWIVVEFFHLFRNLDMVLWIIMVFFVEFAPIQSFHLWIDVVEGSLYP